MPSVSGVESVRSKYILSKTIDGLENSLIGKSNLTVYMMEQQGPSTTSQLQNKTNKSDKQEKTLQNIDQGDDFEFHSKRINAKEIAKKQIEKSFFRKKEEMEDEMTQNASNSSRIYLGNLRKKDACIVLKNDFICFPDCESNGNLKEADRVSLVFVKLLKCLREDGKKGHFPLCLRCNDKEKTTAIISFVKKDVIVTDKFKQDKIKPCKHSDVAELLFSWEESNKEHDAKNNCKVVIDDEKRHLCISFDGETHGLIWVNKARKANKGTCQKCCSVRCKHVQIWNRELKKEVITNQHKEDKGDRSQDNESAEGSENFEENEKQRRSAGLKLNYPYDKETQDKMRESDGSQYENLIDLISKPEEHERCEHNNEWSVDDPVEKKWIYSNDVQIYHSTYVAKRKRTVYFRKTKGGCDCIHLYDGKKDLLLPISQRKDNDLTRKQSGRLGYKSKFVSISLLSDWANDFFRNGTSMIGFLSAHNSKCEKKYGMHESEVLDWKTWRIACIDFFNKVLTIDESELFKCIDCGPRPKVLVIDGIAMGIMKSEIEKHHEDFTEDLKHESRTELEGSQYKDRMFIKLLKNRKKLRKAAETQSWPSDKEEDEDDEYEVGEKRKKTENDCGMEEFEKFLMKTDKKEKPNKGIIMMMENLSTSTSTIGMMQEYDHGLLEAIENFLRGDKNYNFLSEVKNMDLNVNVRKKYPILMKIIEGAADAEGNVEEHFR